ncbi:Nn.00g073900.m01.CDS01 [Neocucurbitaria sp. VM-36]
MASDTPYAFEMKPLGPFAERCPSFLYRPSPLAFDEPVRVTVDNGSRSKTFNTFRGILTTTSSFFLQF